MTREGFRKGVATCSPYLPASALLLLVCCGTWTATALEAAPESSFHPLMGVYEPSGVAQLEDGRLLAVEDEASRPFVLLSPAAAPERFRAESLRASSLLAAATQAMDDLEAVTVAPNGFLFAAGSHSRKDNGKRNAAREQLLRFRVREDRLTELAEVRGLRKALVEAFPELDDSAREKKVKRDRGLNIEGLAFDRSGEHLWLGFRGPLFDDRAILIQVLNPNEVFDHDTPFRFASSPVMLALDGGGIRDLAYVPRLNGYLILSQREDGKKEKKFKMWLWSGEESSPARRVRIDGVDDLERAEGVAPIRWQDEDRILLMSDDGERSRRKPARYLLVDYSTLRIETVPESQ